MNHTSKIYLSGAGGGEPVEALKSEHNILNVGEASSVNQNLYFITDAAHNFSPRLGIEVNGILGYSLFKDFVVEVNYVRSKLILHRPETYRQRSCRSCIKTPILVKSGKPYAKVEVEQGDAPVGVYVLVDSGSGDALWLFPDSHDDLKIGKPNFDDLLGLGMTGDVTGKRAKLQALNIEDLAIKDVTVAYPDSLSIRHLVVDDGRNGSLGGEILKRFKVIYDYPNGTMTLKKNKNFDEPYRYNRSGLIVEHSGYDIIKEIAQDIREKPTTDEENPLITSIFKATNTIQFKLKNNYEIADIRPGSPGDIAGLQKGDRILKVNGRDTGKLELEDITKHFFKDEGYLLKLQVERKGIVFNCRFALKKIL